VAEVKRSCYRCSHQPVCRMTDAVMRALDNHMHGFVDVNRQATDERSWIRIFDTLAVVCTKFDPRPE
jgi:hypothetical protein